MKRQALLMTTLFDHVMMTQPFVLIYNNSLKVYDAESKQVKRILRDSTLSKDRLQLVTVN